MTLFAKAVAISIFAGVLAALPFAALFAIGMDLPFAVFAGLGYLAFGVAASMVIGLPIAALVFKLIKSEQSFDRMHLILVANGTATMIATLLGVLDGWFGAFFLGLPTFLAANVYAIAGWRLILRSYRDDEFA